MDLPGFVALPLVATKPFLTQYFLLSHYFAFQPLRDRANLADWASVP